MEGEGDEPAQMKARALNRADNWYCLSVKQQQGTEEVGYRTLWDYMNLSAVDRAVTTGNEIAESVSNYIRNYPEFMPPNLDS